MKICALILICTLHLVTCEYSRYKLRGPPNPPRPPPYPQYVKKWHQRMHRPPPPIRSRPIPVHMPSSHKIPMGIPPVMKRPIVPPVRTFWKNTQFRAPPPMEKHHYPQQPPEKSFISSPTLNNQDYEFHIQQNTIPTHNNPIKQVGEKGPIHTIPAPNLSLADKPIVVQEVRQEIRHPPSPPPLPSPPQNTYLQSHQYQVTEAPEQSNKFNQQYYENYEVPLQSQTAQTYPQTQKPTEIYINEQLNGPQIDPKELYQLLSTYPQQQQQILEAFNVPVLQSQYGQQPNYQNVLPQTLFQPDQNYVQQVQAASDKVGVHPEFHSFNYEEQKDNPTTNFTSHVTATYSLQPSASDSSPRNSMDALAQSQYIQSYFDTREDSVTSNNVEPDAKPSEQVESNEEEPNEFFASLPNKQAAERLASLQAAGKVNSNLMKNTFPISIYVPDEEDDKAVENNEKHDQYEDYTQDDMVSEENRPQTDTFGHRIKPKRDN